MGGGGGGVKSFSCQTQLLLYLNMSQPLSLFQAEMVLTKVWFSLITVRNLIFSIVKDAMSYDSSPSYFTEENILQLPPTVSVLGISIMKVFYTTDILVGVCTTKIWMNKTKRLRF